MSDGDRYRRKQAVFHIMYGTYPNATEDEMRRWRGIAADYINGRTDDCPMTLFDFRAFEEGHISRGENLFWGVVCAVLIITAAVLVALIVASLVIGAVS